MSDKQLQKSVPTAIKEKGQYLLAFTVVGSMLLVAGFPVFVIFFFAIFAYFILRMFSAGSRSETREIFEFYLTANEIIRDDERRWYGFEINEAIRRGEDIVHRLSAAPPLVYFSLGALQNKAGNHKAAVGNLAFVIENPSSDESAYAYPSPELRNYVKVLRKIERDPADAPLTSAAIRALERARKIRGKSLLEESRQKFSAVPAPAPELIQASFDGDGHAYDSNGEHHVSYDERPGQSSNGSRLHPRRSEAEKADPYTDRKSISEVLHDIYDKNVQ